MTTDHATPLVMGGHSFISQLGTDPAIDADAQLGVVAACLDAGVTWFDTTYQPERLALGGALDALGRRDEATIIAWNFFIDFGPGDRVGGARHYRPDDLPLMLEQLRTDRIDCRVVHALGDEIPDRRQEELAARWLADGAVGRLGCWHPGPEVADRSDAPYGFMVRPLNVDTPDAGPAFAACKALGWETLACSPFVRGRRLDALVQASQTDGNAPAATRARVADAMLRYSLFAPDVDRLIVQMRRAEWVARNTQSTRRGPLTEAKRAWLKELSRRASP